jgi:hypothetical protein
MRAIVRRERVANPQSVLASETYNGAETAEALKQKWRLGNN